MSDFRTALPPFTAPFRIAHSDRILLLGSCFTDHIGGYLSDRQFRVLTNPFGISYNPVSLSHCLLGVHFQESDFFENGGIWRHWELHSELAHPDLQQAMAQAQEANRTAQEFLATVDVMMVTLGTSEVFELQSTGDIVANCHKMPSTAFQQRRLSVSETVNVLKEAFEKIRLLRPDIKIVLTVSPVRHLRNGAVENQRSKAVLHLACAELGATTPNTWYFPAYELLMDDLRDYRFYASDMLHPSETAVAYIWERFGQAFFEASTAQLNQQIEKINTGLRHRPFNPDTAQHQAFLEKIQAQIAQLQAKYPWMKW